MVVGLHDHCTLLLKGVLMMKEKLIELIQSAVGGCSRYWASVIAEYLIEHGVTVPVGELEFDYNAEDVQND